MTNFSDGILDNHNAFVIQRIGFSAYSTHRDRSFRRIVTALGGGFRSEATGVWVLGYCSSFRGVWMLDSFLLVGPFSTRR